MILSKNNLIKTKKGSNTNIQKKTERNLKEKEDSKQRILKSATKLFARKGYSGVGIREICKDAHANICMISYFWGGKEGLYRGIVKDLVEKQITYARSFINVNIDPSTLSKDEQIKLLYKITDLTIEFLYGRIISDDLFLFLLRAQQTRNITLSTPAFLYFRKVIAAVFDKNVNDKDVIFKSSFLISQINSPRVLPAFSLELLNQKTFTSEDKEIIKKNAKIYIKALLEEENK